MTQTPRFNTLRQIGNIARAMGGAVACASATESGRTPSRAALKAVGIDPEAFYGINRK